MHSFFYFASGRLYTILSASSSSSLLSHEKNNKIVFLIFFSRDCWIFSTYVFAIVLYYSSIFHLIPLSFTVFFPNVFVLWFLILLTAMYVVDCMMYVVWFSYWSSFDSELRTTHHRCFCTWIAITVYCYLRHHFVEKKWQPLQYTRRLSIGVNKTTYYAYLLFLSFFA